VFNPIEIDETVTLDNIIKHLKQEEYLSSLLMALKMNEFEVIDKVFKCVPLSSVNLLSAHFPSNYLFRFLDFLCVEVEKSRNVEWTMHWVKAILKYNGKILDTADDKNSATTGRSRAILLKLFSSLSFYDKNLKKIANENIHMMDYMIK